jgi:hypothetical protein
MAKVDERRAKIKALIEQAQWEASIKGKPIETVDPLVACAKRMYPYLPDNVLHEYARTALRVITNGPRRQDPTATPQPAPLTLFLRQ